MPCRRKRIPSAPLRLCARPAIRRLCDVLDYEWGGGGINSVQAFHGPPRGRLCDFAAAILSRRRHVMELRRQNFSKLGAKPSSRESTGVYPFLIRCQPASRPARRFQLRSAGLSLPLRRIAFASPPHSRLAERHMLSLSWRRYPPDLLSDATDWLPCLQNLPKAAQKTILRTESPLRHREAAER